MEVVSIWTTWIQLHARNISTKFPQIWLNGFREIVDGRQQITNNDPKRSSLYSFNYIFIDQTYCMLSPRKVNLSLSIWTMENCSNSTVSIQIHYRFFLKFLLYKSDNINWVFIPTDHMTNWMAGAKQYVPTFL